MTDAKPESAHDEFRSNFKAGNLDALVDLYEDDATFFLTPSGDTVSGKEAIRKALSDFLALGGDLELITRYAARSGEIALLSNEWHLSGTGADGQELDVGGKTTEVVRLQADGRWLYVVDHPWGAD